MSNEFVVGLDEGVDVNGNGHDPDASMDLFAMPLPVDEQWVKEAHAQGLIETGWYHTVTPVQINAYKNEPRPAKGEEGTPDYLPPMGERVVFRGFARLTNPKTQEGAGGISLTYSHQGRQVPDKKNPGKMKWDTASKLFADLAATYKAIYGTNPSTPGEIAQMFNEYPVAIRVVKIAGDNPGNYIAEIRAIKTG